MCKHLNLIVVTHQVATHVERAAVLEVGNVVLVSEHQQTQHRLGVQRHLAAVDVPVSRSCPCASLRHKLGTTQCEHKHINILIQYICTRYEI